MLHCLLFWSRYLNLEPSLREHPFFAALVSAGKTRAAKTRRSRKLSPVQSSQAFCQRFSHWETLCEWNFLFQKICYCNLFIFSSSLILSCSCFACRLAMSTDNSYFSTRKSIMKQTSEPYLRTVFPAISCSMYCATSQRFPDWAQMVKAATFDATEITQNYPLNRKLTALSQVE